MATTMSARGPVEDDGSTLDAPPPGSFPGTQNTGTRSRRNRGEFAPMDPARHHEARTPRRQDSDGGRDERDERDEPRRESQPDPIQQARDRRRSEAAALRASLGWWPAPLLDLYVQQWIVYGDADLALSLVRQDPSYENYFPRNRRPDFSIRLPELEYIAYREAFDREFIQRGYNPEFFRGLFVAQVEGDVSINEFRAKLDTKIKGVINNIPQVRSEFGRFYNIESLDDEALIAASLDPDLGLDLLEGRVQAAQVAGEAAVQGFMRSRERSELLSTAGGLNQQSARQLYSQGVLRVPQMNRFAARFNEAAEFDIGRFEQAQVFGDVGEQRTMQRLLSSEAAIFGGGAGQLARDPLGLVGLQRR